MGMEVVDIIRTLRDAESESIGRGGVKGPPQNPAVERMALLSAYDLDSGEMDGISKTSSELWLIFRRPDTDIV